MSTLNTAVFEENSEEEQDPDFVPEDDSESSDEDTAAADRVPTESQTTDSKADIEAKKEARASLWASFQSSVAGTSSTGTKTPGTNNKEIKTVKVQKQYLFAGKMVSEIIEVPEDSDEAKKWPIWRQPSPPATDGPAKDAPDRDSHSSKSSVISPIVQGTPTEAVMSTLSAPRETKTDPSPPPTTASSNLRRPGPRKPKTTLTPLPQGKPKKLTTLEKSAMDWRAHVSGSPGNGSAVDAPDGTGGTENLADELERNRRGGGYLEKVAFLERVENRREELFDESRKRRRKG